MSIIAEFATDLANSFPSTSVQPAINRKKVYPSITYTARDGVRELFYVDSFGLRTTAITLNLYAKSYEELQSHKEAIKTRYHGLSGTLGSAVIQHIRVVNVFETSENAGTDDYLYRCIIDLEIID